MNTYKISFTGKVKGAIGCFSMFTVDVIAKDRTEAIINLYKDYEHVLGPEITQITPEQPTVNERH